MGFPEASAQELGWAWATWLAAATLKVVLGPVLAIWLAVVLATWLAVVLGLVLAIWLAAATLKAVSGLVLEQWLTRWCRFQVLLGPPWGLA